METQSTYNYKVVRQFAVMTVIWGIVGMLVGVIIAAQLVWPGPELWSVAALRSSASAAYQCRDFRLWRLRIVRHPYYVVQRTCQVRLFAEKLAAFTFWGWQLVIVLAAVTLPLGFTSGRNTPSWNGRLTLDHRDLGVFTPVCSLAPSPRRKVKHIYVANWFTVPSS